jgi:AcrR family transcriptional regulator
MSTKLAQLPARACQRSQLLDLAMALVAEEGVEALTVDRLARYARLSKLHVLGHFSSASDLCSAVVEHSCARFNRVVEEMAAEQPGRGAWLRAYVQASLWEFTRNDAAAVSLFAILPPGDPRNRPYVRFAARWHERAMADGIDPGSALLVKFGADAVWFERHYGTISDGDVLLVRNRLLRLIEEAAKAG